MNLYTTCFFVSTKEGRISHNALVAIHKKDGAHLLKWDFSESFISAKNKTATIYDASSDREAFETFVKRELWFDEVEIVSFAKVKL